MHGTNVMVIIHYIWGRFVRRRQACLFQNGCHYIMFVIKLVLASNW